MTDHIEVLREILADTPTHFTKYRDTLRHTIAALSAREGGEAVGVGVDVADGLAHVVVRLGNQVIYSQAHPAQPASQQGAIGEIVARPYGYGVDWLVSPAPAIGTKLYASQQANPTGDRVRGLVEKWRADGGVLFKDPDSEWRNCRGYAMLGCADELAAALDQEKGR